MSTPLSSGRRAMNEHKGADRAGAGLTRREFLQAGAAGAGMFLAASARGAPAPGSQSAPASRPGDRPSFLFLSADELGLDALSAHGCKDVRTPNMDRLARRGMSFMQSYTSNPLCSPARSSWFTGRMPSETGVVNNGLSIRPGMPTMGQVLRDQGYETCYAGKWHIPASCAADIPGFRVLPVGVGNHGHLADTDVSQACQAVLAEGRLAQPFLLVASLLQPHDIVSWIDDHRKYPVRELPHGLTEDQLPALPPNFRYDPREPAPVRTRTWNRPKWTELQWRYYLWSYYRHVEMVDAEIGRILDALENSPYADNTVVVFTSDHGEGRARHQMVLKSRLYEQGVKVPLIVSWPGQIGMGVQDDRRLVSCVDILPTICGYANVKAPEGLVGRSLRPLLEGKDVTGPDAVFAECAITGRMVRTPQYKYIAYQGDPVEQLFDLRNDPWETRNLAAEAQFAAALEDHRNRLAQWESRLDRAPLGEGGPKPAAEEE